MRPLLAVNNLSVSLYKRPILRDISFEIMPRQVFMMLGPSAGGKSTIMRTVCGLLGEQQNATVQGQILYKQLAVQNGHAPTMAIQNARMVIGTVFDNLSEQFPKRTSFTNDQLHQNIEQFLCKLGLEQLADSLDKQVLDLSKVQRRKLLIANALLEKPALIALDEPATDLDEDDAHKLLEFIHSLTNQHAVMMITRNQAYARAIANVVCLVAGGRIQECRPVDEFFANPQSQPARDFVHTGECSVPQLSAQKLERETVDLDVIDSDDISDDIFDELPEIEFSPLHEGPTTEPDFGCKSSMLTEEELALTPSRVHNVPTFERPFFGDRPKTLTSNPIHTESHDDFVPVNEIPFDNDVFAVIEEIYTNKQAGIFTRFKKRDQPHPPTVIHENRGPRDFRWLRRGVLAGTPQPGLMVDIKQDLNALKRVGITHLITLTEEPLPNVPFQDFGIQNIHFPIVDREVPTLEDAATLCTTVADLIARKSIIAYHCLAGIGRTGTMLVAQLIWEGMDADAALQKARTVYSQWVQSETQEAFLSEFQHWIRPSSPPPPQTQK